ncbi:hypothetical protein [Plesiocystis pacifica]|uniref:hypothetical protein n=1 Tax=Plesiocystis pacifica TaxID=191768 RepID=UPI0012F8BEF9|nr:hypothetical protein [Plesiocystis pacifica]
MTGTPPDVDWKKMSGLIFIIASYHMRLAGTMDLAAVESVTSRESVLRSLARDGGYGTLVSDIDLLVADAIEKPCALIGPEATSCDKARARVLRDTAYRSSMKSGHLGRAARAAVGNAFSFYSSYRLDHMSEWIVLADSASQAEGRETLQEAYARQYEGLYQIANGSPGSARDSFEKADEILGACLKGEGGEGGEDGGVSWILSDINIGRGVRGHAVRQFDFAIEYYKVALEQIEGEGGPPSRRRARVYTFMADACIGEYDLAAARHLHDLAESERERIELSGLESSESLKVLGDIAYADGMYRKAEQLYLDALESFGANPLDTVGGSHSDAVQAELLLLMGKSQYMAGRCSEASKSLSRSASIREDVGAEPPVLEVYSWLGAALQCQGDSPKALEYFRARLSEAGTREGRFGINKLSLDPYYSPDDLLVLLTAYRASLSDSGKSVLATEKRIEEVSEQIRSKKAAGSVACAPYSIRGADVP